MNALPTPPLVAGPLTATPSVPQQATPTLPQAQAQAPSDRPARPLYRVSLAVSQEDVRAAQRLRHQVFAGELGARLDGPEPGLDSDAFDAYCDHLLVREVASGDVIATYRLLPPERARIAGRLYAESEFDIGRLAPIRDDLIEVGRSCVHPAHRDGAVIALIWAGLARYMERSGHNWLAGCCSISLSDGGVLAADSWDTVRTKYLAPEEYWVTPHRLWQPTPATRPTGAAPLAGGTTARTGLAALPPLLRGYLRLGAWVCGAPAHDPDFNVADLYVLLSLRRTDPRYLRHFLSLAPLT
ncbi:GNAT family N-acetyltransferase [Streptomyces sp. 900116325]